MCGMCKLLFFFLPNLAVSFLVSIACDKPLPSPIWMECQGAGFGGVGQGTSTTLNHSFTHSRHTFVFGSENIIDVPANHLIWKEAVSACPPLIGLFT